MKLTQVRPIRLSWLGFTVLLSTFWISACDADAPASPVESSNSVTVVPGAQSKPKTINAELWEGESRGHVVRGDPADDEVAFLVHLGRVQAAIGRANHYDKEEGMTNPFTPRVLAGYSAIDPVVSGRTHSDLSLQPLLSELAAPETFATIVDPSPSKRMARNAIQTQMTTLVGRVDAIVTEFFPSTRTSALAMSALHREAGELLRTGLAIDGQILDIVQYRDALRLMEASLRLRVNKASLCDRSRAAVEQLNQRGPLGDLLDRLIVVSESGAVGGNAGDVFKASEKLAQLGASLPNDDGQICK